MQNSDRIEDPEKVLNRRLELVEEIYGLTKRQREAIRSENWDDLKVILDEKDRRINQFQETEKYVKGWKSLRVIVKGAPSLKRVLKQIESRLVAVQSMEEECRGVLMDRKDKTAKSLQEFRRARQGIGRFKSHGRGAPRFVDLRK